MAAGGSSQQPFEKSSLPHVKCTGNSYIISDTCRIFKWLVQHWQDHLERRIPHEKNEFVYFDMHVYRHDHRRRYIRLHAFGRRLCWPIPDVCLHCRCHRDHNTLSAISDTQLCHTCVEWLLYVSDKAGQPIYWIFAGHSNTFQRICACPACNGVRAIFQFGYDC